jgi:adenylate cyclase
VENKSTSHAPRLELSTTEGKRSFSLVGKNHWKVGRSKENDLIISDPCISRNHAILQLTETGTCILIDLGSRNGTFVNDRPVGSTPVVLQQAAIIFFGKTKATFYRPNAPIVDETYELSQIEITSSALHERRLTTVLVVDIRNYTLLARQVNESLLSLMMGSWSHQAGNIVQQYGSWVDKYIGDAVMAIWFHAQQSVTYEEIFKVFHCVNQLRALTESLSAVYPLPFELRIGVGINTGYSMVGNTGSRNHPEYTAIGDTVNAAFRLESISKEIDADIVIGETTFHHLSKLKVSTQIFKEYTLNLKGYEIPIIAYGLTFADLIQFLQLNEPQERISLGSQFPDHHSL